MALKEMQFPESDRVQFSPEGGAFVTLATMNDGVRNIAKYGYMPPYGIFVEFQLLEGNGEILKGMTASLGSMGPFLKCWVVFVTVESGRPRVYLAEDVAKWRELVNYREFTPDMLAYTYGCAPQVD